MNTPNPYEVMDEGDTPVRIDGANAYTGAYDDEDLEEFLTSLTGGIQQQSAPSTFTGIGVGVAPIQAPLSTSAPVLAAGQPGITTTVSTRATPLATSTPQPSTSNSRGKGRGTSRGKGPLLSQTGPTRRRRSRSGGSGGGGGGGGGSGGSGGGGGGGDGGDGGGGDADDEGDDDDDDDDGRRRRARRAYNQRVNDLQQELNDLLNDTRQAARGRNIAGITTTNTITTTYKDRRPAVQRHSSYSSG